MSLFNFLQQCPAETKDVRQEECEKYNVRSFAGKRYEWDAYNNPGFFHYFIIHGAIFICRRHGASPIRYLARVATLVGIKKLKFLKTYVVFTL